LKSISPLDNNTLGRLESKWQVEFDEISRKKSYLLGIIASLIFPATLIDYSLVPVETQSIFIASRVIPPVCIILYLLAQRFLNLSFKPGYYLIFITTVTASAFRVNAFDTDNFLLLSTTVFIMYSILASLRLSDAIIMAVYGLVVNIAFFFLFYADTIPLHQGGLLIVGALEIVFILVIKFRYDILKRNYFNSMILQKQKEEIELQRNNLLELNEEIHQQKEEILSQRDAIEEKNGALQKALGNLARKNANITASITYAKRIQDAMLPSISTIQSYFPHSFVFYKPRDIVSGDFYWITTKNNWVIFAAVDCTGHGVPGAFMSITGDALLTQIVEVQGIVSPDVILNELHLKVRKGLKQEETQNRDGMDISICAYNVVTKQLHFAGAQNQLLYMQDETMHRIRGDRQPIGGLQREKKRLFTNHTLQITKPTMCYMFSDGFQDQFGGMEGKKFMAHRFRELLMLCHKKPVAQQHEELEHTFSHWIGQSDEKQIDDVLVIGFLVQP